MRTGPLCFIFDYPRNIVWRIVHTVNIDQLSFGVFYAVTAFFSVIL